MSQELATRDTTDLVERAAEGRFTPTEAAMLHRLVKLRPGQPAPSREELALVVAEALHLGLDPFAGQCYFIKFNDAFEAYPHWSGLVKIAEDTGEYQGADPILYSDDGKTWSSAWVPDSPPRFARATVYRRGHRPQEATVKWSRANKGTPNWKSDPEGMLGKAALRLAIRKAFPKEADKPLSADQLRAVHTLASIQGMGGEQNRSARLEAASEILGRPVESFKELSASEATELYETWAPEEAVELTEDALDSANEVGDVPQEADAPRGEAPAPAASIPDNPGELATLQKLAVDEFRRLSSMLPAEWRPWFRNNVEEIRAGAWEGWPGSFGVAELKELFERLEQVRPWGETQAQQ